MQLPNYVILKYNTGGKKLYKFCIYLRHKLISKHFSVNMSVSATHNGTFITLKTISDRADIKFLTADTQHYIAQSVAELRARGEDDAFIVTDLAQVKRTLAFLKCLRVRH